MSNNSCQLISNVLIVILLQSIDQKLQKRAQRFGTVVSEQLKKVEDSQKLIKRKERFGATAVATTTDTSSKRKISASTNDKVCLDQRLISTEPLLCEQSLQTKIDVSCIGPEGEADRAVRKGVTLVTKLSLILSFCYICFSNLEPHL